VDKATHKLLIHETEVTTIRLIFDSYTNDRLGTHPSPPCSTPAAFEHA